MTATDNKQLMQAIFDDLAQGNSKAFVAAMADDFRWTIMGTTKWSRTFEGKEAVLGDLLKSLRAVIPDRIRTIADRFIADGDHVVVLAHGQNLTKAGVPYNNRYCYVFRLAEGRLRELTEYLDTELVTKALGDPAEAA
ncbi:nuclear transport factor 2 family protein [Oleomonas cavernae]|uniref:Nuclear transport factor 2 family protein n=1 Tax=Oleomonas cavernae TaxID=2320859 RepID=A0A418WJ10_9PROT|nr:nuclear transport factor 2 family protein [Oleomonas cavernae]RJF89975.1 nuclear transport factor 2 family protein [Oleomonas cavernae]